jgi:hypothetical protein
MIEKGKYYKVGTDLAMEIISEPRDLGDKVAATVRMYNVAAMRPFFINTQYVEMLKTGVNQLKEMTLAEVLEKKYKKPIQLPEWIKGVYEQVKKR